MNIALFPNAEVVDFWARYRDDLWLDHDGEATTSRTPPVADARPHRRGQHAHRRGGRRRLRDDPPVVDTDRTPEIDPLLDDQAAIEGGRERVLAAADIVIPGHGGSFRVER